MNALVCPPACLVFSSTWRTVAVTGVRLIHAILVHRVYSRRAATCAVDVSLMQCKYGFQWGCIASHLTEWWLYLLLKTLRTQHRPPLSFSNDWVACVSKLMTRLHRPSSGRPQWKPYSRLRRTGGTGRRASWGNQPVVITGQILNNLTESHWYWWTKYGSD